MSNDEDPIFATMRQLYESPIVQDFYHHVATIAGFNLPPSLKGLFEAHHSHFFTDPRPSFTVDWGEASTTWRWQKLYSESVFGSSQSAAAAVLYHRENLLRMERDLISFLDLDRLVAAAGQSSFGGGNTQKLDFEYHGFVFAYRRALDYLARGIAALLHQNFNSFRRLPDLLAAHTKHAWVTQLIEVHSRYTPTLDTFLGNRTDRSTRDRIAHYTHVPAGCLNVNVQGVFFAGGGEELDPSRTLGVVIDGYVHTLRHLLADVLQTIADGHPKHIA